MNLISDWWYFSFSPDPFVCVCMFVLNNWKGILCRDIKEFQFFDQKVTWLFLEFSHKTICFVRSDRGDEGCLHTLGFYPFWGSAIYMVYQCYKGWDALRYSEFFFSVSVNTILFFGNFKLRKSLYVILKYWCFIMFSKQLTLHLKMLTNSVKDQVLIGRTWDISTKQEEAPLLPALCTFQSPTVCYSSALFRGTKLEAHNVNKAANHWCLGILNNLSV